MVVECPDLTGDFYIFSGFFDSVIDRLTSFRVRLLGAFITKMCRWYGCFSYFLAKGGILGLHQRRKD